MVAIEEVMEYQALVVWKSRSTTGNLDTWSHDWAETVHLVFHLKELLLKDQKWSLSVFTFLASWDVLFCTRFWNQEYSFIDFGVVIVC